MFYSQHILTKKGPLAKVWLAAHVHTKLTKAMALTTNVQSAVARIISPDAPMALRLTSQLLLGVVRIFSRKTKYLLADSSDALARLKLAYTPASSNDLEDAHANPAAITIANDGGAGRASSSGGDTADAGADAVGLPMLDLDFPAAKSSGDMTPRYLADAKDITIDDYASGVGSMSAFGRDPDLDLLPVDDIERDRMTLDYEEAEPLMFTPSQERSTPRRASASAQRASEAGSIEQMRDAAMPDSGAEIPTPRMSLGFEDDAAAEPTAEKESRSPRSEEDMIPAEMPAIPSTPGSGLEGALTPGAGENEGKDSLGGVELPDVMLPANELSFAEENDGNASAEKEKATEDQEDGKVAEDADDTDSVQKGAEDEAEPRKKDGEETTNPDTAAEDSAPPGSKAAAAAKAASRKRKASGPVLWDAETELPAQFVYESLQDTSDLVRPVKRGRTDTSNVRKARTAKEMFEQPVFPGLAPELQDFFSNVVFDAERVWREPGSPITAEVGALSSGAVDADVAEDAEDVEDVDERGRRSCDGEGGDEGDEMVVDDGKGADREVEDSESCEEGSTKEAEAKHVAEEKDSTQEPQETPLVVPEEPGTPAIDEPAPASGGDLRMSFGDESMGMPSPVPMPEISQGERPDEIETAEPGEEPGAAARTSGLTLVDVANTRVVVEDGDSAALGEAMISQRSLKMRDLLDSHAEGTPGKISFTELLKEPGVTRRVAARSFYELLNLSGKQMVSLEQSEPYTEITVTMPVHSK